MGSRQRDQLTQSQNSLTVNFNQDASMVLTRCADVQLESDRPNAPSTTQPVHPGERRPVQRHRDDLLDRFSERATPRSFWLLTISCRFSDSIRSTTEPSRPLGSDRPRDARRVHHCSPPGSSAPGNIETPPPIWERSGPRRRPLRAPSISRAKRTSTFTRSPSALGISGVWAWNSTPSESPVACSVP